MFLFKTEASFQDLSAIQYSISCQCFILRNLLASPVLYMHFCIYWQMFFIKKYRLIVLVGLKSEKIDQRKPYSIVMYIKYSLKSLSRARDFLVTFSSIHVLY
jgi:hypothetical protein